jgi:Uma2 family endonuclease
MATVTHLLTYEEWLQMPPVEDGTDEVVKGELRFMPPTRYPHAEIIDALIAQVMPQLDRKRVRFLGSNLGLMISREPLTCRSPDLIMFWRDKMEIKDGLYYSPPGLIVEILSPSEGRKRKEEKMEDYASIGVPEVWLCSPQAQSIEVRRLSSGKLERTAILVDGTLEPALFPGVTVAVAEIWPAE